MAKCGIVAVMGRWLAALGLLLAPVLAVAQQPQFDLLVPETTVYPQYFSVEQGSDRMLYVGYSGGVLRFDGARWTSIDVPGSGAAVRQLHRDRHGRLWVGATDAFGYLQRQADGSDRYVDVSAGFADRLKDAHFADIWAVLERDDGLYFRALRHVFHVGFDGGAIELWHHEGRFGGIAEINGELWLQWRGQGLKHLVDGRFEMLPGGESFAPSLIYNLIQLPDGRAVVHSLAPRFAVWDGQRFADSDAIVADPEFDHLVQGMALEDGQLVFSGDDGVLRFVDVDRQRIQSVPIGRSYIAEVVRALDGALLAISDDGVARLPWPPQLLLFDEGVGFRGIANSMRAIGDSLYLLAGSGIYQGRLDSDDPSMSLQRLDWTGDEAWDLIAVDDGLLLADSRSLLSITGGKVQEIANDDLYPRKLLVDEGMPDRLWVGTEQGVTLMQHDGDRWQTLGADGHQGLAARSLAQRDAQSVWVGTLSNGLMVAEWSPAAAALQLRALSESEGGPVAPGGEAFFSHADGQLWASTSQGLFRLEGDGFVPASLPGLDALKAADEVVEFADDGAGGLWATSYRAYYHRNRDGNWRVVSLAGLRRGAFLASLVLPGGDLLMGGASTLLRAERDVLQDGGEAVVPLLVSAQLGGRGEGMEPLRYPLDQPVRFASGAGTLEIAFALPDLDASGGTLFQSRLAGLGSAWSEWNDRPSLAYPALPPGDYRFELRARNADGRVTTAKPLDIIVAPRWYQRQDLWLLGGLGLLLAVVWWLQRRHRERLVRLYQHNRELDALVRERTRDLEEANVKLRSQAERDGLTGVGNRAYFDSRLAAACATARRSDDPLALLMIDVDHFKPYNDQHGHLAGDEALRHLARVLSQDVRESTAVARYGGEEFALIAERCTADAAERLARRLVAEVANDELPLTISIGVATFDASVDDDPSSLVRRADDALYVAKRDGRNRVAVSDGSELRGA